ncbi:class I SAM-dependent methyltransferase [Actinoplanes sp. L3-i22]|uniref:class I SAM-dependent DNA methyltransferase n=1 Tax=Actinoplanes sp. L3-i22 TaxID=2836373 RepID=UPI001C746F4A|nr:class I SAM-dependent methyltransferase [Actinoplanes sp. L3-i22]BCY04971.1 methyltransferase [Actinoplanes sp. L3-i22]
MSHLDRTRTAYDTVARPYATLLKDELRQNPWDRAVLAAFAEVVTGPVLDAGCGPGRLTGHLADLGLAVGGLDLSPEMIAVARETHPLLEFTVGSVLDLDLPEASLGGVVAWYSLIHTPPEELPRAFTEFHRVLAPGGHLVIAFKVGDGLRHPMMGSYGPTIELDIWWHPVGFFAGLGASAGFAEVARLERAASETEHQPQGYLMFRKP